MSNNKQTCGRFILLNEKGNIVFQCASLELPWLYNQKNISCIPSRKYDVKKVVSGKFGPGTFRLTNVSDREHILIHPGNFTSDIEGCILLGEKHIDFNNDNITDVVNSKATIDKLKKLADSFELTILWI